MNRVEQIREKLTAKLHPTLLNVIDDSAAHVGHAGSYTGGGHFTVEIEAPILKDKKRIDAHRMIYEALGEMMQHDIHALSIKIL